MTGSIPEGGQGAPLALLTDADRQKLLSFTFSTAVWKPAT